MDDNLWHSIEQSQWHPKTEVHNNPTMTIGDRIRETRKALGLSRTRLAEISGVKYPTLAGIEAGHQKGSTQLHALAEALGVSARWLETGTGAKHLVRDQTPPEYRVNQPKSQAARLDFKTIGSAVQVLREYLHIRDEPPDWVSDPVLLEIAFAVVEEFGEPMGESNLLVLTKRFAEQVRNVARPVTVEGTGIAAGGTFKRSA